VYLLQGDYQRAEAALTEAASQSVSARTWNNLGVTAEMRGDPGKAAAFYAQALEALAGTPSATPRQRRAIQTNLARVKSTP
jgi:Tfp pilus assembly protein PilF